MSARRRNALLLLCSQIVLLLPIFLSPEGSEPSSFSRVLVALYIGGTCLISARLLLSLFHLEPPATRGGAVLVVVGQIALTLFISLMILIFLAVTLFLLTLFLNAINLLGALLLAIFSEASRPGRPGQP